MIMNKLYYSIIDKKKYWHTTRRLQKWNLFMNDKIQENILFSTKIKTLKINNKIRHGKLILYVK